MIRWIVFTSLKTTRWKLGWLWAINVSSHNFRQKRFYSMMTFWRTTESFYSIIRWVANTQYLHLWNKTILQKCIFTWNMKLFLSQITNFCRVWYAGSYLQVWRQTDANWHDSGPQMFRHTIFDKRGAILWWLFKELLKVFTWLVGFPYQLSIISALKHLWTRVMPVCICLSSNL
jgi:hypothetical protein